MRLVPWWAVVSAVCAPLLLVGGWAVAGLLHGPGYDPVTETISLLARRGAPDRWVMGAALMALGVCDIVTALGLRPAFLLGRIVLAAGGVTSVLVSLSPVPHQGASHLHGMTVVVGFSLLALWPCLAAVRRRSPPWALRPGPAALATASMLLGAAWFMLELRHHGAAGAVERLVTAAQAAWPLVVVLSCLRHAATGSARARPAEADGRTSR
ncbi:DUF998 domain-containing protein [Kitasatospora camelliae]|uniref:DUF998 domain-containing protein n=1 Tax=Kitasatospora camelliae TaxID=3156397 RepID=A0AAU8JUV7_9ACTN